MNERDRALAEAASIASGYVPEDQRRERRLASDVAAGITALIHSRMVRPYDLKAAANPDAWGIGEVRHGRFFVRRIVWGVVMARAERRDGETIRRVILMVRSPATMAAKVCRPTDSARRGTKTKGQ